MGVAQALDIRVVAVGVETPRQLAALERLGCQYGQGFLWSSATDGEALLALASAPAAPPSSARSPGRPVARGAGPRVSVDELDSILRSLVHEIRTPSPWPWAAPRCWRPHPTTTASAWPGSGPPPSASTGSWRPRGRAAHRPRHPRAARPAPRSAGTRRVRGARPPQQQSAGLDVVQDGVERSASMPTTCGSRVRSPTSSPTPSSTAVLAPPWSSGSRPTRRGRTSPSPTTVPVWRWRTSA